MDAQAHGQGQKRPRVSTASRVLAQTALLCLVGGCVVAILLAEARQARDLQAIEALVVEYLPLESADIPELWQPMTHDGGVVIIDLDSRSLHGQYTRAVRGSDPHCMYARRPSAVRTLVFVRRIPETIATYDGGFWISGARTDDPLLRLSRESKGTLSVVKENISVKIVDLSGKAFLAQTVLLRPTPQDLPQKIGGFMKVGGAYMLAMTKGEASQRAWNVLHKDGKPYAVSPADSWDEGRAIEGWVESRYCRRQ